MPARTLNDFFAGFFMGTKSHTEAKMALRLDKEHGKGGSKVIKVEGGREKEREVIVRPEIVFSKWKRWNHDDLLQDWNKNYSAQ